MSDSNSLINRRGSLGAQEPGARGLEHMARNRQCLRLAAITIAAISPAEVSEKIYGITVSEGLSPFAIRRGDRFEAALFEDGCKRLRRMYETAGRLSADSTTFQDMSVSHPGITPSALKARLEASQDLVRRRASGEKGLPNILVKPRLVVSVMGHDYPCEPDALVACDDDLLWRVVEIKSYADRWSSTDVSKTGSACRQSAVGIMALQQALDSGTSGLEAEELADLIFAKPATNWPTLNVMSLQGELENLRGAISGADLMSEEIVNILGDRKLDQEGVIDSIPNNPCSGCADHCPLWDQCRGKLIEQGDPVLLGDGARELMARLGSLDQALSLRDQGSDPDPDLDLLGGLLADCQSAYLATIAEESK